MYFIHMSSQVYLYRAFHNIDCIKAASRYQSKHINNNVRFFVEKYPLRILSTKKNIHIRILNL